MLKQITKDKDIVKLGCSEELSSNIVKPIYLRMIKENIENEQIFRKIVMDLMPEFLIQVQKHELLWGKDRSKFTVIEREKIMSEFEKKHIEVLQGAKI